MTSEASPQAEPTEQFARRAFRELHQLIIEHEAGAIAGEVESVHDMRVGIRRLRVALSNFTACLPKEDRKRLRQSLGNLANALGGVRDLDVMIDALKARQTRKSAEDHVTIGSFISRFRARRRRRHRQLVSYLQGEEYAGFKHEFSVTTVDEITALRNMEEQQDEQAA